MRDYKQWQQGRIFITYPFTFYVNYCCMLNTVKTCYVFINFAHTFSLYFVFFYCYYCMVANSTLAGT